jgi:hypothetical protein
MEYAIRATEHPFHLHLPSGGMKQRHQLGDTILDVLVRQAFSTFTMISLFFVSGFN